MTRPKRDDGRRRGRQDDSSDSRSRSSSRVRRSKRNGFQGKKGTSRRAPQGRNRRKSGRSDSTRSYSSQDSDRRERRKSAAKGGRSRSRRRKRSSDNNNGRKATDSEAQSVSGCTGSDSRYSASSEGASSSAASDAGNNNKAKSDGHRKDEIVHFDWQKGMSLNDRYDVLSLLGDGTFGRVLLARDRRKDRQVAVKVIRDIKRYMENAKIEADILADIRKADPGGSSRCAILYDTFVHDSRHLCLVFEPLGSSLYDFMKKNSFRGFWMQDIQSFAKQCLKCLKFLHEKLQMTHTDLKPENILIQSMSSPRPASFPREKEWLKKSRSARGRTSQYMRPQETNLKIIDFGNATYEGDHHSSIINTRQYRGPEVVLELGWNERSDIWSLGCILMELYSGELLFGTHENLEHLALMEKIVSPLPGKMLRKTKASVKEKYLREQSPDRWELDWPQKASSTSSARRVSSETSLADHVLKPHLSLVKLVKQMLTQEPSQRLSAAEALKHPFFSEDFED
mmetsp:Transcript_59853/g.142591  ORF Transcript_59853/g.142591 Transcript_59853/m.142591 type:complete len:511 (+) Transcript_59853:56-1588(+)